MWHRWGKLLLVGIFCAGCASIAGTPIGEALELATMGRERPLRQPMRPIRGETRVLVIAIDGVGREDLLRALREGRMPRTAALLGAEAAQGTFAHAYSAPDVVSILPSSTIPAWVSIFTGKSPAHTGVPGNEWFVREEMKFYAPVPSTVRSRKHATQLFTDELHSELIRVPTLYERVSVRAHVAMNPVFRGADLLTLPNLSTFGDLAEELAKGTIRGSSTRNPGVYRETDQSSVRSLIGALRDHGVPDVQVAYFPGVDLATHHSESPLDAQQRYLVEVIDPAIGQVLDAYAELGASDRTYVLLIADHGHTPVLPDDRHSLHTDGDDEPAGVLRQIGFRVRPFALDTDEQSFQAVLAHQGAMAYVYLADRSTCPDPADRCDWSRPPRLAEDLLPAARAFWEASQSGARVPELRGSLDLILVRLPEPSGSETLPVRIFDGQQLVTVRQYLREHPRPDLVRLEERLRGLAAGPYGNRAGDLILMSRFGVENPIEQRFYFAPPEWSEHGSAHGQDSYVPLIVAHPRRSGADLGRLVRAAMGQTPSQLDVLPLIEEILRQPDQ